MIKIALYGKGGIGKSTCTANLSAALASLGKRVIQIGCDPKADSTINLLHGDAVIPVMDYMRKYDEEPERIEDISKTGYGGVLCIETGGPTPGLGCAGRGIITTFSLLEQLELFKKYKPEAMAIEKLFYNTNAKTVIDVAQARGVTVLAAYQNNAEIFEYTPLQVKQSVVGYGRAEKKQVQEMIRVILNLEKVPKPDDTADALAMAICHAHSSGSLMGRLKNIK